MSDNQVQINKILSHLGISELNDMQLAAIKANEDNKDIILLSATGSGKTLAFLLPLVQALNPENKHPQALIIVPSRELAIQIDDVFRKMQTGFKVTLCYGGHKREIEETNLIQAPAVIIGTAGRLADHIRRGNFNTAEISTLILDEFDKSLDLGFTEEMEFIVGSLKNVTKRVLTSATESVEVPAFVGINEPIKLNYLADKLTDGLGLEIKTVFSEDKDKIETSSYSSLLFRKSVVYYIL